MMKRGMSFAVFDEPEQNVCTVVAAGLFNPVTGQKLTRTWMAEDIFPYLHRFYPAAEELTGHHFFYPLPLYRPFTTVEEQNEWMGKSADGRYRGDIDQLYTTATVDGVRDVLGGLMLKNCGFINSSVFTKAIREQITRKGSFQATGFHYPKLVINSNHVLYEDIKAAGIIFCEGTGVSRNPWFNALPIHGLKGETIYIKSDYRKDVIVNRGVYMVPGNASGEWRVGATYNLSDKTNNTTREGRTELEQKLKTLVNFPFEVTGQDWGIRPTSADRRPILGKHPKFDPLYIFNGLGTKGVSLAPYFSEVLLRWIENPEQGLNKQVNVTRFKSLY
jgi:glycine oxidase